MGDANWLFDVDERCKRRILGLPFGHVQAPIGQVTDVRCESKSQAVAQKENMVSKSECVSRVLFDADVGLVVQQSIEYVRGVSDGGADDLGVERRIAIGDVGIERESWLSAVPQIDGAGVLTAATDRIALAVGG